MTLLIYLFVIQIHDPIDVIAFMPPTNVLAKSTVEQCKKILCTIFILYVYIDK